LDHYVLFDETHARPTALKEFVRTLGQHNDTYETWQDEEERKKLAEKLIELLPEVRKVQLIFHPSKYKKYQQLLDKDLAFIDKQLQSHNVRIADFHRARRKLRTLANVLHSSALEDLNGPQHWFYYQLYYLQKLLGNDHDALVQEHMGNREGYEEGSTHVKPEYAQQFSELRLHIEKVFFKGS
jgi:hypothetical protein